ncbi:MAG: hypothetical protein JSS50_02795 [Proteobacteria bacterium]|nr:hypothetical protein [Pseudomonadota bacterium]
MQDHEHREADKTTEETYENASKGRRTLVIFGAAIVEAYKKSEKAAGMYAQSLAQSDSTVLRAIYYPMQGLYYALRGSRAVVGGAIDMIFSPNGVMLWTMATAAFIGLSTWGAGAAFLLFGITAGAAVITTAYRAQQLFEIEQVRREHRILSELNSLNQELGMRRGILSHLGISLPDYDAPDRKEFGKDRKHNPGKGIFQGFINSLPDWAVNIAALLVAIIAVSTLSPYMIGLAVVVAIGDLALQINAAVNIDEARTYLVNDIELRKSALGLSYTGHTGQTMAEQINVLKQKYHDAFLRLEAVEKRDAVAQELQTFKDDVEKLKAHYTANMEKSGCRTKFDNAHERVKGRIDSEALDVAKEGFSDAYSRLIEAHQQHQLIVNQIQLKEAQKLANSVTRAETPPKLIWADDKFQELDQLVQKTTAEGGKTTYSVAPENTNSFQAAQKALSHAYTEEKRIIDNYEASALAVSQVEETVDIMIKGRTMYRPPILKVPRAEVTLEESIADIGEEKPKELRSAEEEEAITKKRLIDRENVRVARYASIGLYDHKDRETRVDVKGAIVKVDPVVGLAKAGGYFSSLIELLAVSGSRSTTIQLFNPYTYYSGRNYTIEQSGVEKREAAMKSLRVTPVDDFINNTKGAGRGVGLK